MNRKLLTIPTILMTLLLILSNPISNALAAPKSTESGQKGATPLAPVGTGFSYPGLLVIGGVPANGSYDFTVTLYDSLTGGLQVGTTLTSLNQTVTDGHYDIPLDFGNMAFWGQARWLQIAYRPAGTGSYTTLTPRKQAPVVPYALSLAPGAVITATTPSNPALSLVNTGIGLSATGDSRGVSAYSSAGSALFGQSSTGDAVYGSSASGNGINGSTNTGVAVSGAGNSGTGVYGNSTSKNGVHGTTSTTSTSYAGVMGTSTGTNGVGVKGIANTGTTAKGVYGTSTSGYGVYGYSYEGEGVRGTTVGGTAVRGDAASNGTGVSGEGYFGVYGTSNATGGAGVYAVGDTYTKALIADSTGGTAVYGYSPTGYAIYGTVGTYGNGYAGYFQGNVHVNGTLSKSAGSFKIDNPLDPEHQYLSHSFVESPDMMNIYNGNITTDANGEAVVKLPDYFEALNEDFRYQLTVMGQFAQAIVSEQVKNNQFTIKTDKPNVQVSWQVTGIRHDPYAEQHRIPVVEDKPKDEQGTYLNPAEYGQPETKGLNYEANQPPTRPTLPNP